MQKLLRYVRRQPAHVRESFALYAALLVTGLIALLWVVQVPGQLASVQFSLSEEGEGLSQPAPLELDSTAARPFSGFLKWIGAVLPGSTIKYEAEDISLQSTTSATE